MLHIEDDAAIARVLARALRSSGIIVDLVTTLSATREALLTHGPGHFDAALLDLALPDGNGLELLPTLRDQQIPVLVVSGHYPTQAPEVISANVFGVAKSLPTELLVRMIRGLLARVKFLDKCFGEQYGLSDKKVEVIRWGARHLSAADAAKHMNCSVRTVETYWQRVFKKVGGKRDRRPILAAYLRFHGA